VPTDENRVRIDEWVAVAPDSRLVETARHGECWTTQALEDGEVRYEETEFGRDEPELNLIAKWCARQVKKVAPRPPAKTSAVPFSDPARKLRG
jgi:hypothetical protein